MQEFLAKYMPPNAAAHGAELDRLNAYVHWLMLILFVLWSLFFLYVLVRYRAKRNPVASYEGAHSHSSNVFEALVLVVEIVLLVGFSIPAWARWTSRVPRSKEPLEVRVVAEQFSWNIHYPGDDGRFGRTDVKLVTSTNPLGIDVSDPHAKDDVATINQLHMILNRPIVIRLTSKDVIHSFALQQMRAKQDAVPGMEIPIHFTPIGKAPEGEQWEISCAQLCGLGHYRMRGMYTVDTTEEFYKWLREQPRMGG